MSNFTLMSMRRRMGSSGFQRIVLMVLVVVFVVGIILVMTIPGGTPRSQYGRDVVLYLGKDHKGVILRPEFEEEFSQENNPRYASYLDPDRIHEMRTNALNTVVERHYLDWGFKKYWVIGAQGKLSKLFDDDARSQLISMKTSADTTAKQEADTAHKSFSDLLTKMAAVANNPAAKPKDADKKSLQDLLNKPDTTGMDAAAIADQKKQIADALAKVNALAADETIMNAVKSYKPARTAKDVLTDNIKTGIKNYEPDSGDVSNPTENHFRSAYVDTYLGNPDYAGMVHEARKRVLGEAILKKDYPTYPLTEDFVKKLQTKTVRASWIFISAKKKMPLGTVDIPDMTPEALAKVQKQVEDIRARIVKTPSSFADEAKMNSQDSTTSDKGGSLGTDGWLKANAGPVPVPVEYWAFQMQPGELSPVFLVSYHQSQSQYNSAPDVGYAIVKVDEVKDRDDVKDFKWDTERDKDMLDTKKRYEQEIGQAFVEEMRYTNPEDPQSAEAKLYAAEEAHDVITADAMRLETLKDDTLPSVVKAALSYTAALSTKGDKQGLQDKVNFLQDALPAGGPKMAQIYYLMGQAYENLQDDKNAKDSFHSAFDDVGENDRDLVLQLQSEFQKLNDSDYSQKVADWLTAHPPQQNGNSPFNLSSF